MAKGWFIRFLGWIIFILSTGIVIAGIIANKGEVFEFGLIGFFALCGAFGFFLTRKGRKKAGSSKPLNEIIQEKKEKSIQKQAILSEKQETIPDETTEPIEDMAYRAVMENRNPENQIFHIEYLDAMGEKSSRDIAIYGFKVENDNLYINAYCYLAKDRRQFRADRITGLSLEGKKINNPVQYLWDIYTNTPAYKTQKALNEHTDEILALVFLARADGKMLKNEREVIGRFIDIVIQDVDAEAVENLLKKTVCELADFNRILKRSKSWTPEIKKLVLNAAAQIFVLKKQPDPMERATFEKLKKAIS
jgi:predicted DNA-binding transcriptional regulator YafY